jgi:hypothetical protein
MTIRPSPSQSLVVLSLVAGIQGKGGKEKYRCFQIEILVIHSFCFVLVGLV